MRARRRELLRLFVARLIRSLQWPAVIDPRPSRKLKPAPSLPRTRAPRTRAPRYPGFPRGGRPEPAGGGPDSGALAPGIGIAAAQPARAELQVRA